MRSPLAGRKLADLLWILAIANAVLIFIFGFVAARSFHLLGHQQLPLAARILWSLVMLFSVALSGVAESAFLNALATNRWPESQVAPIRKLLDHPAVSILTCSLFAGAILFVLAPAGHSGVDIWLLLLPMMTICRLRSKSLAQSPTAEQLRIAQLPPKRLQSSHWGTPAQTRID